MKNLVICGDSYNIGIGCHDLHNEPYGSLEFCSGTKRQ